MTNSFKQLMTDAQRSAINAAKRKNLMARTLAHEPEPEPPPYIGRSYKEHGDFRVAELDRNYDPAWPDQRDVVQLGAHHAREAANSTAGCARGWLWNCAPGGYRNRPAAVSRMLDALVPRIHPALHAAEKEFDPQGLLRSRYEAIESEVRSEIADIAAKFKEMREGASKAAKTKIRKQEIQELQVVLDGLAAALQQWQSDYPQHSALLSVRR
jgi:hypothetical protein